MIMALGALDLLAQEQLRRDRRRRHRLIVEMCNQEVRGTVLLGIAFG